jgi:TonB family protein
MAARIAFLLSWLALPALAHEPLLDGGVESAEGPLTPVAVEAPVLSSKVDPVYPPLALEQRREAHVHLELLIDETGKVEQARILESGGEDFDTAILLAVQQYVFKPATQKGQAARALVRYTHFFRLPQLAPVDAGSTDFTTVVLAHRPLSAASSFSIRDRDFTLRPIGSVQDILRVTPGLVMVQHSGGGKANQYFLRGFDADHGTDLALSVDGVPVNMVSHAHGQGFADTNFIIPEAIERVEVTKGPYFAQQGDFATAGSVNMVTREAFEHSSLALGFGGSPGHGGPGLRGLLIASPHFEAVRATFAAELGRTDGPFDNAEGWNRYKLFNRISYEPTASARLSLIEMSYGGSWHGSGQIPSRAVEAGQLSRFGSLDPEEGGATTRHQLALTGSLRPDERSELKGLAYVGAYRFNLFSNFTLYLNDPVAGDEIEQVDGRTFCGGKLSYRIVRNLGPVRFDTTVGADVRRDDIHNELWSTLHRDRRAAQRSHDVHETLGGAFVNEEVTPFSWLRLNAGGRVDLLGFTVTDRLAVEDPSAAHSGTGGALQLSPKVSLAVTPLERDAAQLELYANYGHGFHSNDVRGAFSDPPVSPLTRAVGAELGARARLFNRWDLAGALWQLDLASETVWSGDEGTTAVSGPTHRHGLELETRFELTSWLAADLDLTFAHSQFTADGGNGAALALAPRQTWSGGLSGRHALGPGVARAGVRFYGIGDRPASDDGALVAPGFTQVDLHLGYRHRRFDVALDIENLFNGSFRGAQFATLSRLRGEPMVGSAVPEGFSCGSNGRIAAATDGSFLGCEDVDFTPAYPFTARVTATVFFD